MAERVGQAFGDRRQELVFIGRLGTMNRARIETMLNRCLVPQTTFTPELWAGLEDPFPRWGRDA